MSLVSFTDPAMARRLLDDIAALGRRLGPVKLMEVCGTHTMEIGRLGLRPLLPGNVELVSGPGCPVCVTPGTVIDAAAELAASRGVCVLTFGDMIRVPGNRRSLEAVAAEGGDVRVVASPLQAVRIAREEPDHRFVFVAVGFETTIPVVARAIEQAAEAKADNLTFLVTHRLVPPALDVLVGDPSLRIDGFILPGHVAAIIGEQAFAPLVTAGIPGVITGFESLDILAGIQAVLTLIVDTKAEIVNRYRRVVKADGNPQACALIEKVFQPANAPWRGIGVIPGGALVPRDAYRAYDACAEYGLQVDTDEMPSGCSCGRVLKGVIRPDQCPLFGTGCTPASPVGPCMVSSEGSCAAYYKYERSDS